MKIFSNDQFDVIGKTYVFDPTIVKFLPIEYFLKKGIKKIKYTNNILDILTHPPSNIFLRYDSIETGDEELREFRIFLHDELRERLKIDGEEIEHKGMIPKQNDYIDGAYAADEYEYCVRDALKKALKIHSIQTLFDDETEKPAVKPIRIKQESRPYGPSKRNHYPYIS